MKVLLLLITVLPLTLSAQLEMRDASHEPVEGYIESSYVSGEQERTVYLGTEVLMSSEDVKEAYASESGETFSVRIEFTDQGAETFKSLTEKRIRKSMAIIIGGEVVSVPVIMDTLSKNAVISGLSKSEAEEIAETITRPNTMVGRWEQDVDATIQVWEERGYFADKTEEQRKETERILRTEVFKPFTLTITPKKFKITSEVVGESEFDYTVEKKGDDWVLVSVKSEEGKLYTLWRFLSPDRVHATNNKTGDLEDLKSSKIVDVYVRK